MITSEDERLDVLGADMARMIRRSGVTRAVVVGKLDVAERTLGRWLAGVSRPPRATLIAFAKLMECDDLETLNSLLRSAGYVQAKDLEGHSSWVATERTMRTVEQPQFLRDIMTPASEIVWISTTQRAQDAAWLMFTRKHRRLLVYDRDATPRGYVHARRVLDALIEKDPTALVETLLKPLSSFTDTQPLREAQDEMKKAKVSIAAVHDAKGAFVGMVTMKNFSEPWKPRLP